MSVHMISSLSDWVNVFMSASVSINVCQCDWIF